MAGLLEHGRGHVHAFHLSLGPDLLGGDKAIDPGTTPYVHHSLAGKYLAQAEGVAGAGERLDGGLRDTLKPLLGILQHMSQRTARVEVKALLRARGDLSVLLPDRLPQASNVEVWLFSNGVAHGRSFLLDLLRLA